MTAMTLTLTDFLLARIADDEERAQFVAQQIAGNNWTPVEQWKLSWHDEYDLLCIEPSRAIAECEAKRRIIDFAFENAATIDGEWGCGHTAEQIRAGDVNDKPVNYCYGPEAANRVLHPLALPYADHEEFRDEWRP